MMIKIGPVLGVVLHPLVPSVKNANFPGYALRFGKPVKEARRFF